MTYEDLKRIAQTGDVLLVDGNGIVRIFTAESQSHVALLVRLEELTVFEFVETCGFREVPLSQWLEERKDENIVLGIAPSMDREAVKQFALSFRNKKKLGLMYGWVSLIKVWLAQVFNRLIPVRMLVCSTFVQAAWKAGGYHLERTADPGDIARHCRSLHRIGAYK